MYIYFKAIKIQDLKILGAAAFDGVLEVSVFSKRTMFTVLSRMQI